MEGDDSRKWSSGWSQRVCKRKCIKSNLQDELGVSRMKGSGKITRQTERRVWRALSPFAGNELGAPKKPVHRNQIKDSQAVGNAVSPDTVQQWENFERCFTGDQVI